MKDFTLYNQVKMFFGKEATSNLEEIAKGHRVLLVYGGNSAKNNGAYDEITTNLKKADVPFYELSGISKAEYTHIEQGIKVVDDNNIDMIIGIGGCSCMDIAKLIAFGYYHRDTLWDYLHGKSPVGEKHLMIVEIPTYPSGGSEFGAGAVAFDSKTGDYGTVYGLRADYAILHPTYSFTLDKEMTAYTGLVTLTQLSASLLGDKNPISYGIGISSAKAVYEAIKKLQTVQNDYDAKGTIMYGSSVATSGWLGLGKESNFAYGIYDLEFIPENLFDVPYRKSLTTIFPRFLLALSTSHEEELKAYFNDVYGFNGSIENSVTKLIEIFESFGLDMYFHSDISDERIREIINEDNCGGLDFETVFKLIKSCIKN